MHGKKSGNLGNRGQASGGIYKSISPNRQSHLGNVVPTLVEVCTARHPWYWYRLCTSGGVNQEEISTSPVGEQE